MVLFSFLVSCSFQHRSNGFLPVQFWQCLPAPLHRKDCDRGTASPTRLRQWRPVSYMFYWNANLTRNYCTYFYCSYLSELVEEKDALDGCVSSGQRHLGHSMTLLTKEINRVWSTNCARAMICGWEAPIYPLQHVCCQELFYMQKPAYVSTSRWVLQKFKASELGQSAAQVLTTATKKIMISADPRRKIVGRILGPRGLSLVQLEAKTECRIVIRGKGSVKVGVVLALCSFASITNPTTLSNNTDLTNFIARSRIRSERSHCATAPDGSTLRNLCIYSLRPLAPRRSSVHRNSTRRPELSKNYWLVIMMN